MRGEIFSYKKFVFKIYHLKTLLTINVGILLSQLVFNLTMTTIVNYLAA